MCELVRARVELSGRQNVEVLRQFGDIDPTDVTEAMRAKYRASQRRFGRGGASADDTRFRIECRRRAPSSKALTEPANSVPLSYVGDLGSTVEQGV